MFNETINAKYLLSKEGKAQKHNILKSKRKGHLSLKFLVDIIDKREREVKTKKALGREFERFKSEIYYKVIYFPDVLLDLMEVDEFPKSKKEYERSEDLRSFREKTHMGYSVIRDCIKNSKHRPAVKTLESLCRGLGLNEPDREKVYTSSGKQLEKKDDIHAHYLFLYSISSQDGYKTLLKRFGGNVIKTDNYILRILGLHRQHWLGEQSRQTD
jgi:hypothetical protein